MCRRSSSARCSTDDALHRIPKTRAGYPDSAGTASRRDADGAVADHRRRRSGWAYRLPRPPGRHEAPADHAGPLRDGPHASPRRRIRQVVTARRAITAPGGHAPDHEVSASVDAQSQRMLSRSIGRLTAVRAAVREPSRTKSGPAASSVSQSARLARGPPRRRRAEPLTRRWVASLRSMQRALTLNRAAAAGCPPGGCTAASTACTRPGRCLSREAIVRTPSFSPRPYVRPDRGLRMHRSRRERGDRLPGSLRGRTHPLGRTDGLVRISRLTRGSDAGDATMGTHLAKATRARSSWARCSE